MIFPIKPVAIRADPRSDTIKISSRPEIFALILGAAGFTGLCVLPFTEYRNDYFAYIGMLFIITLTGYYVFNSIQVISFENRTNIHVRQGILAWNIPFESVTGGYTSYNVFTSGKSHDKTHFLSFRLKVDLPDNKRRSIRNGTATVFHYGFSQWGAEQEKLWQQFNDILDDKGIQNLTSQ